MASKAKGWQPVSLTPLTGALDTRYRSTEAPDGGFRWKLNFPLSENGQLCRLAGFEKLFSESRVDSLYVNWDLHSRTAPRKPITKLWEITGSDGRRYLYAGDENGVWRLNELTGEWTVIISGKGAAGTRWSADVLQDTVIFTNNHDPVLAHDLSSDTAAPIDDLTNPVKLTKARLAVQLSGIMLLMNTVEDGKNFPSRIRYSDLNRPRSYGPASSDEDSPDFGSIAGFQDLDYGEEILAAAELKGSIIVYTNRSLWRVFIGGAGSAVVQAQRIYSEPKNNTGCIVYPDSLVSTGDAHYYGARESFYTYNPYLAAPDNPEWLRQATGVIYTVPSTKIDESQCLAMTAEFKPLNKEIWISWPTPAALGVNDISLVLSSQFQTATVVDAGFTAFSNFKPISISGQAGCNTRQILVGASGRDLSLKQIAEVFFREYVTINGTLSADIPSPVYRTEGYVSMLRGIMPLGLPNISKQVKQVALGQYTAPQVTAPIARLRIGTSTHLVDPNFANACDIVWHNITPDVQLKCQEALTSAQMIALNQIPSEYALWNTFEQGQVLYFEISVLNADGTACIGGDTHWYKIDFTAMALQV